MTHRAETILEAFKTTETGLATTGTRVERGRVYATSPAGTPNLRVFMGADEILEAHTPDRLLSALEVTVEAEVAEISAQVDTKLNVIREEVTVALAADHQLGLPVIVQMTEEVGAGPVEISGEGDRPAARQMFFWSVTYERSRSDPAN